MRQVEGKNPVTLFSVATNEKNQGKVKCIKWLMSVKRQHGTEFPYSNQPRDVAYEKVCEKGVSNLCGGANRLWWIRG